MDEFKDSKTALIADVDCTVEEALCASHNIEGYPTIKYGDPNNLEDYEGEREYDDLLKHAQENLGPVCGLANMDICDDAQKKEIAEAQALSNDKIKEIMQAREDAKKQIESEFEKVVEELEAKYQQATDDKDKKQAELEKNAVSPTTKILKMVAKDRGVELPKPPDFEEDEPPEGGPNEDSEGDSEGDLEGDSEGDASDAGTEGEDL